MKGTRYKRSPVRLFFLTLALLPAVGYFVSTVIRLEEETWDGTVNFYQTDTGPDVVLSEWKMDGTFKRNRGPVLHSSRIQLKERDSTTTQSCKGNAEGRLEVSIDETRGVYSIYVHAVPECVGTSISQGKTEEFRIPGGDSVIIISDQPIGKDKNKLSGTITLKDGPYGRGIQQTHLYKWNLVKAPN